MSPHYRHWVLLLLHASALVILASTATIAQEGPGPVSPVAVTASPAQTVIAPDSPRAAFRDFRAAAHDHRWLDAARYVPLPEMAPERSIELAKRLKLVLDGIYALAPETLSAESSGRLDDGLPRDVEEIGHVPFGDTNEPIRLVRVSDAKAPFWSFSPATVGRIDAWYDRLPNRWLRDDLTSAGLPGLLEVGPLDIVWWQWIALPFVALLATGLAFVFHIAGRALMTRLTSRTSAIWDDRLAEAIGPPISLFVSVIIFATCLILMRVPKDGLDHLAPLLRVGTSFSAVWALWRLTNVVTAWARTRRWANRNPSVRSLLAIGYNLARSVIISFGILGVLASFGYPVGTVLAGLGIGGLALAFGAQKTIENLFGSIALAADQPFRVGDWVKVDDLSGSVEDIGVRSTRLRTADRTLVTIPNGKLADQRVESFSARDRMRITTTIGLTYRTSRAQLMNVLAGIEQLLRGHAYIASDEPTVAFRQFGGSSLDIEVSAWFYVNVGREYDQCRQQVLLGIMEIVEREGTAFAFPTRTVHVVQPSS